jgi:SlyX protein
MSTDERLLRLEEKIAHLERHVTEQDKAMLEMAGELAALQREVRRLREPRPEPSAGGGNELPDERPPHY